MCSVFYFFGVKSLYFSYPDTFTDPDLSLTLEPIEPATCDLDLIILDIIFVSLKLSWMLLAILLWIPVIIYDFIRWLTARTSLSITGRVSFKSLLRKDRST